MNPSYENGGPSGSGVPGMKPGVIASGPDPEDVPSVEMPSGGDAGLSLGSNKHLFRRPRAGTPSRSMVNVGGGGIGSGSGGSGAGSKKGIIIAGLLGIVILIAGLVVGLTMGGGNGGGGNVTGDQKLFLEYANFLLNGDEDTSNDIGSFDENEDYAVTTAYVEDNKDFFNKAQELWKVFYDKFIADENRSNTSKIVGDVEYQNQLMDFAVKYMNTTNLDDSELLKLYLKDGLDNANKQVEDNYKDLLTTIFKYGEEYATTLVDRAKKTIKVYSIYDSYGCVINEGIDDICLENNDKKIALASTQYIMGIPNIDTEFIKDVVDELADFCFRIEGDFGAENEEEI